MVIRLGERDEYTLRAPREEVICIDPAFNSIHSDTYPPPPENNSIKECQRRFVICIMLGVHHFVSFYLVMGIDSSWCR